jgi:RNA-directed DNA polymerase
MHRSIPEQGKWLGGSSASCINHAMPTNSRALNVLLHHVTDLGRRTLRRRNDRITYARMKQLVDAWLPKPMILHPWPGDRFAVTLPMWR